MEEHSPSNTSLEFLISSSELSSSNSLDFNILAQDIFNGLFSPANSASIVNTTLSPSVHDYLTEEREDKGSIKKNKTKKSKKDDGVQAPVEVQEKKRERVRKSEEKRRKRMKGLMEELKSLLPNAEGKKLTKDDLIIEAINRLVLF